MAVITRRRVILAPGGLAASIVCSRAATAQGSSRDPDALRARGLGTDLDILPPGASATRRQSLAEAMRTLNIPSVSIAMIEGGTLAWTQADGDGANADTLYQAASLSKLVTAVAALRLVEAGRLSLDRDVNDYLMRWRVPPSPLAAEHPVTLRGLLSMTAGIGVPGYLGYAPGEPLPDLLQILDGTPPANSPPVRVETAPGARYAYSGGGYEIVQALIEAVTGADFATAMQTLLLRPAGMADSTFAQPPPPSLAGRAARGHAADGKELPGGWRVIRALAAGGLWSTPADLAKLLIAIARAYRGEPNPVLSQSMARAMFTRQNGGPYGLGGAVDGEGRALVLMKRGQNVGYQSYMLIFPETGDGIVAMTGSDNGTALATALIRRAAAYFRWPALGTLAD